MNLAYGLFIAEAEGYLDTHYSKVQALIKDLKKKQRSGYDSYPITSSYLKKFDLTFEDLTSEDWEQIDYSF